MPARGTTSTFAFTIRLCAAIALTFALLGAASYVMIRDQLERRLLETYTVEHRADAASFDEAIGRARTSAGQHSELAELLDAIARRPGVTQAELIGPDGVIEAAGNGAMLGRHEGGPAVTAALRGARSYTGRETNPGEDHRDLEFVVPVDLSDGRHAFEVTRDHSLLDSQLHDVRRTVMLLVVAALFLSLIHI